MGERRRRRRQRRCEAGGVQARREGGQHVLVSLIALHVRSALTACPQSSSCLKWGSCELPCSPADRARSASGVGMSAQSRGGSPKPGKSRRCLLGAC